MLSVFRTLTLLPGYVLRAYQFMESAGGNGVVYAMAADSPFPDPGELEQPTKHLWETPKPPGVLDDCMDAIKGDDTPWSYVEASLCARALWEHGAYWHGIGWTTHSIIGTDYPYEGDWKWKGRRPRDLTPTVYFGPRVVRVTFHSYSYLGQECVCRHVDTYKRGKYLWSRSVNTVIAEGPFCMLM